MGRSATVSVGFVRGLLFCTVASFMFCFFAFVLFVTGRKRYERDFKIDEMDFRNAVVYAVTNVLSPVVQEPLPTGSPVTNIPVVVVADSWYYWDELGRDRCCVNGVRYSVGDYSQFGLVVRIAESGMFCRSGDGFTIVKPSYAKPAVVEVDRRLRIDGFDGSSL